MTVGQFIPEKEAKCKKNEESIFVTLSCFSISLTYRCASCLAYACQKQALYKQLGVTVNQLCLWCRL